MELIRCWRFNMFRCIYIPIIFLFSFRPQYAIASSILGIPDGDTAALIELITLTASQLNELEKLVSNAEKYTEKMQKYNEIVQDHYYRLLLIQDLVQDLVELKDFDVKNLGDVNNLLRNAIYKGKDLKEYVAFYTVKELHNDALERDAVKRDQKLKTEEKRAGLQASRSFSSSKIHTGQMIAQNTGKTYHETVKQHRTINRLLAKQAESNAAKHDEMKVRKKQELEKEYYYGLKEKSRAEKYRESMLRFRN